MPPAAFLYWATQLGVVRDKMLIRVSDARDRRLIVWRAAPSNRRHRPRASSTQPFLRRVAGNRMPSLTIKVRQRRCRYIVGWDTSTREWTYVVSFLRNSATGSRRQVGPVVVGRRSNADQLR